MIKLYIEGDLTELHKFDTGAKLRFPQWTKGQRLVAEGLEEGANVYFFNKMFNDIPVTKTVYLAEDDKLVVDVPNILLTTDEVIKVRAWNAAGESFHSWFAVEHRVKPADYDVEEGDLFKVPEKMTPADVFPELEKRTQIVLTDDGEGNVRIAGIRMLGDYDIISAEFVEDTAVFWEPTKLIIKTFNTVDSLKFADVFGNAVLVTLECTETDGMKIWTGTVEPTTLDNYKITVTGYGSNGSAGVSKTISVKVTM